ncbi:ATP-binding protein [Ramlibacter albus]|uniref:ATP-binding protein n=1 Tax=Ramlibacter albus TaxID=2079448 RepID=A0A923S0Z9_9BURK|nr:ATP-binding protein [Ramlibacter albus]MBC5763775.1 ATP-binding protein [Ramlibacter albus]
MKIPHQMRDFHGSLLGMLTRQRLLRHIEKRLGFFRAVELTGPRQVGKSTLARHFLPANHPNYFDLELPAVRALFADPEPLLANAEGLVVIDEVQHAPRLYQLLRYLIDRPDRIDRPGQYLLLGSASHNLLKQEESLLGRVATVEVTGLTIDETGWEDEEVAKLWLRGGFPLAFLAPDDESSLAWRQSALDRYVRTDLPGLVGNVAVPAVHRFMGMLSHLHGQVWNAAAPAQSMGVNESTVRRYLDFMTETFMIRQLPAFHENLGKRQVKAPKIYFRDSGFLHALWGVRSLGDLLRHPHAGASWEGFALEQVLRLAKPQQAFFWATHQGAELDLVMLDGSRRIGVEFKRSSVVGATRSMHIAMHDLKLDALYVVYGGPHRYYLADRMEAVPLWSLLPSRDVKTGAP